MMLRDSEDGKDTSKAGINDGKQFFNVKKHMGNRKRLIKCINYNKFDSEIFKNLSRCQSNATKSNS